MLFHIKLFWDALSPLDFIHHPDFNSYKKKEEQTRRFGNWICFRPQVRGDTYSVGSLSKS
jgi:hypothetical protein